MTTLHLDDELYQRATQVAAAKGITIEEFVGEALRYALSGVAVTRTERNGIPVMVVNQQVPRIIPTVIRRILEEEGF